MQKQRKKARLYAAKCIPKKMMLCHFNCVNIQSKQKQMLVQISKAFDGFKAQK